MLSKDFKEFIELLGSNNVKYLVVGMRLRYMDTPVTPKDIDYG